MRIRRSVSAGFRRFVGYNNFCLCRRSQPVSPMPCWLMSRNCRICPAVLVSATTPNAADGDLRHNATPIPGTEAADHILILTGYQPVFLPRYARYDEIFRYLPMSAAKPVVNTRRRDSSRTATCDARIGGLINGGRKLAARFSFIAARLRPGLPAFIPPASA